MATMRPVLSTVKAIFSEALRKAFPSVKQEALVLKTKDPKFGDYQCNNAMGLYRDYGKSLGFASPAQVAEAIKSKLPPNDVLGDVTISPQGFVSVKISEGWLAAQVSGIIGTEIRYADSPVRRVVVDFSSPNIAKEMHVGHLRSSILGETLCRILEFAGHEVHRLNHVGDWGTQFGMLIEYMKEAFPGFIEGDVKSVPDVSDLNAFYKAAKKRFDDDDDFKKKSQLAVVDLQSGGVLARRAWQQICDISRKSFNQIYDRLGVKALERGESYYNDMIPPLVEELKERGLVVESKGALCIFTPGVSDIPLMVVKADGGFGYDSTDLAAVYHRLFVMRAEWVIYLTDLGQEPHFHMIFDAAKQAGWHRQPRTRMDHMGFGVVQGEDKKRFKTRSGETVKLVDLLDEAVSRASTEIANRVAEQEKNGQEAFLKDADDQTEAAEKLGIAAVRYFDMKQSRTSNYVFNYDKMLDSKGNSAVFLFYAYARIRAIQRKSGVDTSSLKAGDLKVTHPAERDLALKLLQFPDVLESILEDLHLHRLCEFLWELGAVLTTFYMKCKVVGDPEEKSRLVLCEVTRLVFAKSFDLLGFSPLERI